MRTRRLSKAIGLFILVISVSIIAACAPVATPAPAPTAIEEEPAPVTGELWYDPVDLGQSYANICTDTPPRYGGAIVDFNPNSAMTGRNWFQSSYLGTSDTTLFSHLFDMSYDGKFRPSPDLAKRWEVSDDGLTFTFYLRDDVLFHDGEKLTAEDVKFTFELAYDPDLATGARNQPWDLIVGAEAFDAGESDEISGIKVLDDYTVQFTLKAPQYDFFRRLAMVPIWPKHVLEGKSAAELLDSDFAFEHPIGSGPFKMGKVVPDQYYTVEAFDDYYAGRPYLDEIVFRLVPGMASGTILAALEAGEAHISGRLAGADRERAAQNPDLVLVGAPLDGAMGIFPSTVRTDLRLRQALMYALDLKAIEDALWGDTAVTWTPDVVDPDQEWLSPDLAPWYGYDPDTARALLEELSWDSDEELELLNYYKGETYLQVLAAMQQYWADVGIKVNIQTMDGATYVKRVYEDDDFDISFGCCGGTLGDLTTYACDKFYPDGWNSAKYCSEEVDALADAAAVEPDEDNRSEMWKTASGLMYDELVVMPMWRTTRVRAADKQVCNYIYRQAPYWPDAHPNKWYLATSE